MHKIKSPPISPEYSIKQIIISALREQKGRLYVIAVTLLVLSITQGVFLLMVGPFLKTLFGAGLSAGFVSLGEMMPQSVHDALPKLAAYRMDRGWLVIGVPALMFLTALIKAVATYFYQLHQQAIALFIARRYREKLFEAIITQNFRQISAHSPAHWMSVIMNDVFYLQNSFSDIAGSLVKDGILVLSCFLAICVIHLPTALALLAAAPFLAFILGKIGKRISWFAHAWQTELAGLASAVLDIRTRFKFVRAQQGEMLEIERFGRLNSRYYQIIRRSLVLRSGFAPGLEFLGFAVFALFIYLIGQGRWFHHFTPVDLIQFFAALGVLLHPLKNLGEQLTRLQETKGSLKASRELMKRLRQTEGSGLMRAATLPFERDVVIHGMSAGYDAVAVTIQNVHIAPAKCIAVIGPSGGGKSTLIKALAGLLEPITWQADTAWQEMCSHASLVSQAPFLFDDSIRNNLLYGLSEKYPSDETIWSWLSDTNLADDIKALPSGLDHRAGAIEKNLSGGQIQRLVIVRALLRNKNIWLFDEATSAIDPATEVKIMSRLIDLCRQSGKAILHVTHRPGLLTLFDEIWFIEQGCLMFKGSHMELLANARYHAFVSATQNQLDAH